MPRDTDQYDFFVSYARDDDRKSGGWIAGFVDELCAAHRKFSGGRALVPFFDRHAINTGADWQLYLAHGLAHSRLFLAFISPNYFASEWCRKEWRVWIDLEIAKHILTEGVAPIYIIDVPGFVGKSALPERQVAQEIARLCGLPEPHAEFLESAAPAFVPPILSPLRHR
jgi:hypothetical protein